MAPMIKKERGEGEEGGERRGEGGGGGRGVLCSAPSSFYTVQNPSLRNGATHRSQSLPSQLSKAR